MIQFDHVSDSFCVKDGDQWLYFDSVLKAKDAVRQVQIKEAALAERAKIVAWLRDDEEPYPDAHDIASAIEAGEHLK